MRFAIDAAYKLGERGEESQVLSVNESGKIHATWTHGQHPFSAPGNNHPSTNTGELHADFEA